MKRFKRAAACLVMTSLLLAALPVSGCKKKNTPMGSNEVLSGDSPWYNIDKNVIEKNYDPSELEYGWSEMIGVVNDKIVMYANGSYPLPDDISYSDPSFNSMDYEFSQIDIYSLDGELVSSVDLKEIIMGSDIFDTIDPEELEGDFNFGASGFGVGIAAPSKLEGGDGGSEDEDEPEDIDDEEDIDADVDEDIDEDTDEDGEGEDEDLLDPRQCWYLGNTVVRDDVIVVSVYCYVGMGHEYEFTIDPDTGDLISVEELAPDSDSTAFEDGSNEGSTEVNGYTITKYWMYDWEGDSDPSYVLTVDCPDGTQSVIDLREEMPDLAIYDIQSFIPLNNGKVIFPMSIQGAGDKYGILDLDAMTAEEYDEDMDWITVDLWNLKYFDGLGNVVMGEDGLVLLDFENKEETIIFDYNWCNINRYDVRSLELVSYSEDELVFAGSVWEMGFSYYLGSDDSEIQVLKLTKSDTNPNAGKTVLVAATTQYLNYTMCEAVCQFNEQSSDYFITIDNSYSMDKYMDYDDIETDEDYNNSMLTASSELTDQLAIDLMAGEGPDIILDSTSFYQLNNDDYLLDVSDRIPTDGYFSNVFEASKVDDKLYQVPLTFAMNGIITSQSNVEDGQVGFTFDQYATFVDEVCNGTDPMLMSTQLDFFVECFTAMNDQFVSNGKVDYDNDAFRALAEYVKDNVADRIDEDELYGSTAEYYMMEEEEELTAEYYTYASFRAMTDSFAKYEDVTVLGIPSFDGRGPLITVDSSVAISAQTQEADACWEFIELLLSEDIQTIYGESDYCTPVNIAAFENTGHAVIDDYNMYVQDQLRWATEAEIRMYGLYELDYSCIDKFQELIESCSQVASMDSAVVTIIREEMPAYFSGQKDIDEVISVMEDRVQTFLDERG